MAPSNLPPGTSFYEHSGYGKYDCQVCGETWTFTYECELGGCFPSDEAARCPTCGWEPPDDLDFEEADPPEREWEPEDENPWRPIG